MQDCNLQGGRINLGPPLDFHDVNDLYPSGSVLWKNNLFASVGFYLYPSYCTSDGSKNDGTNNLDLPIYAYNNLFKGGYLTLVPILTSNGDWVFNDNLFDQVGFDQDPYQPLDAEYNGYWLTSDSSQLMNNDGNTLTNNQFFTNPPPYQSGPFGNYYMAPGTVLANHGSTNANLLGLYYYTTATNQTIQGFSTVDIGLHYVAASYSTNGWVPLATNGIPDFLADVNGNGPIPSSATNPSNAVYANIDLDGDGMVGAVETALDKNPLVFDNPLMLTATGYGPTTAPLKSQSVAA